MTTPRLTALAKELRELKDHKERLEEDLKLINKRIQGLIINSLPEAMDEAEQSKFSVDGVGTVYLQDKINVSILADDRGEIYEWCRANGHEALVVDYIHPSTLNAWAKEQLINGGDLPDKMKATYLPTAMLRRK